MVPPPGVLAISRVPPTRWARSRMPAMPMCSPTLSVSIALGDMPAPSSHPHSQGARLVLDSDVNQTRGRVLDGIEHRLAADAERRRLQGDREPAGLPAHREHQFDARAGHRRSGGRLQRPRQVVSSNSTARRSQIMCRAWRRVVSAVASTFFSASAPSAGRCASRRSMARSWSVMPVNPWSRVSCSSWAMRARSSSPRLVAHTHPGGYLPHPREVRHPDQHPEPGDPHEEEPAGLGERGVEW